ncbi:hypothetical protein HMPREF1586_01290, partial [Gardnerella vaginalis JCP8522]
WSYTYSSTAVFVVDFTRVCSLFGQFWKQKQEKVNKHGEIMQLEIVDSQFNP